MKTVKRVFATILIFTIILSSVYIVASAAEPLSTAGKITTASGNLNIRSSNSTSSLILTRLPSGTFVTLLSKSGDWWYIEYAKGQKGYCSASYITQIQGTYAAYASSNLNIRTGAGTAYSIKGWLNSGDYVVVLSSFGTWKKILYNGSAVGYVSGLYLNPPPSYYPISLKVPDYKQTDSRWSDVPLGSNGGTIGSIGCSTVSLAMSESYRTGSAIYPNNMKTRLNYTAGGAVYWPRNYTAYFGSNYLAVIYNQLKAGKPVLMGSKNNYGGQHWVVVTGFSGASLTSSQFTINDPGSSSRTTLQQYFSVYPNFYKIMYY